jgi:hypothetical protein
MSSNGCCCLWVLALWLQEKLQSQLMLLRGMLRADAAVRQATAGSAAAKVGSSNADRDEAAAARRASK